MSKKSDTTRPKPDLEQELEPKRLKSESELGTEQESKLTSENGNLNSEDSNSSDESSYTKEAILYLALPSKLSPSNAIPPPIHSEQEPKLTSETFDPISEESYEFLTPDAVYGKLNSEDSDSSDDESCRTKADVMYLDLSRKLSPYDAIPPPTHSYLCGGNPIRPLRITKDVRPILENLSKTALDHYQNQKGSGASFEFHKLIKCTRWYDVRPNAFADYGGRPLAPTEYYITFQAKAKGDPSNSPAITIFQAKVLVDKADKNNPSVVKDCHIKKI
jgi:hypothetical protein